MTRIEEILKKARYSLADPDKQRYSDERLLSALSDGQKDIARQTKLLKGEVDIPMNVDFATYSLPEDLWLIERVHFNNRRLPLMSFDRMDAHDASWYTKYGSRIESVVYDKRDMHSLRVYPRPDKSYIVKSYTFLPEDVATGTSEDLTAEQIQLINAANGTISALLNSVSFNLSPLYLAAQAIVDARPALPVEEGVYGVVTSVDGTELNSPFGVVADLNTLSDYSSWPGETAFDSPFGVTTSLELVTGTIHIFYIKDPDDVVRTTDQLTVSPMFDTALRYFVIGQAYGDDLDTEFQAKSTAALNMYDRELSTIGIPTNETDGTRADQYKGPYVGAFS